MNDDDLFKRTRVAIAEYDADEPRREVLRLKCHTARNAMKAFAAWDKAEKVAHDKVREAFYQDTKDRNTRERAFLVHVNTLREWVSKPYVKR